MDEASVLRIREVVSDQILNEGCGLTALFDRTENAAKNAAKRDRLTA